jgi:hypothetical protein
MLPKDIDTDLMLNMFATPTSPPEDIRYMNPWRNQDFTLSTGATMLDRDAKAITLHIVLQQILANYYEQYDLTEFKLGIHMFKMVLNVTRVIAQDFGGLMGLIQNFIIQGNN